MTVTLTYDQANAKVTINATQLGTATLAIVERSINQVQWATVRGGVALAVTAGALAVPLDDYEFTPGVTNFYRVSAIPKGVYLPGTSGNYASTPDTAVLDITGDLDIRADIRASDWTPSGTSALVGKWTGTGGQQSYILVLNTSGSLGLWFSTTGANVLAFNSTQTPTIPSSGRLAVRATRVSATGVITFYTAPTIAGPWTPLGSTVAGTAGSMFAGTAPAAVGAVDVGTALLFAGVVIAAEVRSVIDGTVVANPDFGAQANLAGSFADAAGRTWTINGTAQVVTAQTATAVPVLDKVWLKSLVRPFLNRVVNVVGFTDPVRPARSTEYDVVSRTLPVAVNDLRSSRRWSVDLYVDNAADAQTLDYILAAGDVMLLQVPRGSDLPSGYVQIKDTGQRHPDGRVRGDSRIFTLPLVEAAPPGPDVAGVIGTWASVLAGYASWDAVLAAFPTWNDLLALHGDPSEVIAP